MRKLTGTGTPREAAASRAAFWACYNALRRLLPQTLCLPLLHPDTNQNSLCRLAIFSYTWQPVLCSTGFQEPPSAARSLLFSFKQKMDQ